jgi:putative flippase GtrA
MTLTLINSLYRRFKDLILYGIIGCFTSAIDFAVFTLLVQYVDLHYIVANCISVLVGISTSFYLNRKYNFKVTDKTIKRFFTFLTVGLCGLMLSNLILWIGITQLNLNELFTKLASIILVVFFQFLFNKFVTFKR